ncbi:type III secretion protein [Herbaspirillum sp. HC18]|nr:type III secretion protein [Herbaspirillum sp. HC18]
MFRAALERHMTAQQPPAAAPGAGKPSLGDKLAGRATNLASEIKKDQLYVSRMLEQASRTGDSMQLMRAMMALNDYQIRVQTISKTVSKATQSFEQLTKLQ